jgi:hypothetical protein
VINLDKDKPTDEMADTATTPVMETAEPEGKATKGNMFVSKNGLRTSFLKGKKTSAKGEEDVWETEEECKARLGELFDLDSVECTWDADRKGYVAAGNKHKPKKDKAPTAADVEEAEKEDESKDPPVKADNKPEDEPEEEKV